MTEEQFQKAVKIKEAIYKIDGLKNELESNYNRVKSGNIDPPELLICLENYSTVLCELKNLTFEEFKKL